MSDLEAAIAHLIETTGALQTGHFKLASGFHASRYFRCVKLLRHPQFAEVVFDALAQRFADETVDYVLGANEAGSILAFEVAKRLDAEIAIARQKVGQYRLIEGFGFGPSDQVLVVDDITSTGNTATQLIEIVQDCSAEAIGVGLIATKGMLTIDFNCRTEVLITLEDMGAVAPEECPLCHQGVPLSI